MLRVEVDAEVGERAAQRRHHPVGGEGVVPARSRGRSGACPSARPRRAPTPTRSRRARSIELLVESLGRVEEARGTARRGPRGRSRSGRGRGGSRSARRGPARALRRVRAPRGRAGSGAPRSVRCAPARAARACPGRRCSRSSAEHPVADRLAVDAGLELRLELGDLLLRARASARRGSPRSRSGRARGSRAAVRPRADRCDRARGRSGRRGARRSARSSSSGLRPA